MGERLSGGGWGFLPRLLAGSGLALAASFTAWFAASLVAARFLVEPGSGLAGAATVAVSGFAAGFIAFLAAVIMAWRASHRFLTTALIIALVCGIGAASLLNSLSRERAPVEAEEQSAPGLPTRPPGAE